ncbi:helix-turn-helix domain-containing protein [Solirubrobacter phytolaccae]|uniref:Helix-turn-helix domain-containing protein n=1 Tax=Solirubrobacter phytolaccae TaxID=1404360 RepID=A0A9X3N6D1_9ACTN|nr:helix-turn-helix domain-containing protein [Solirubrobacter phytolaccae]MDA0180533.1 helix-turn-helix domain-containing protein [Solirubrobacter phytolaccae]
MEVPLSVLAETRARTPTADVATLRRIHLGMIDAVLAGGGIAPVAALAAEHLHGTVAIVLPAADIAAAAPDDERLPALEHYVAERLRGGPVKVPPGIVAEVEVRSGDEPLGAVLLTGAEPAGDAREILELAALAALTAVTLRDQRVSQRRAAAALFDELEQLSGPEVLARAQRLGADLSHGASALVARPPAGHTDRVLAAIAQELPGALAAARGDFVEALTPGSPDRLTQRLRATMPVGVSPQEPDPAAFGSALKAAAIALQLGGGEELLGGSWRLLIATGATNPGELRSLVGSTVGPAPEQHDTLRAYFEHGANMNATANAIYAHRHTIGNRLERVRVLTGHDPQTPAGQAQLSLGLQALDVERAVSRLERR